MTMVNRSLIQLYKPILPHQIRQLWQTRQPFRMVDFAGQKISFFFSQLKYAEELASNYANELHETCFVLAFYLEPTSYPYIEYYDDAGEHGKVYGIAANRLEQCFPGGRQQTKIISACHALPENDTERCDNDRQQFLFSVDEEDKRNEFFDSFNKTNKDQKRLV